MESILQDIARSLADIAYELRLIRQQGIMPDLQAVKDTCRGLRALELSKERLFPQDDSTLKQG